MQTVTNFHLAFRLTFLAAILFALSGCAKDSNDTMNPQQIETKMKQQDAQDAQRSKQ